MTRTLQHVKGLSAVMQKVTKQSISSLASTLWPFMSLKITACSLWIDLKAVSQVKMYFSRERIPQSTTTVVVKSCDASELLGLALKNVQLERVVDLYLVSEDGSLVRCKSAAWFGLAVGVKEARW